MPFLKDHHVRRASIYIFKISSYSPGTRPPAIAIKIRNHKYEIRTRTIRKIRNQNIEIRNRTIRKIRNPKNEIRNKNKEKTGKQAEKKRNSKQEENNKLIWGHEATCE